MKTTIDMAREAGYMRTVQGGAEVSMASMDCLKAFEALVRADEREEFQRWFDAVTAQHKQEILAEREACAVIAGTPISGEQDDITMQAKDRVAAAIRARGNT